MEQDKNRWSYWSSRGAIVALILLSCVAAFEFVLGFIVTGKFLAGEFLGLITFYGFLILIFLYLVYFFLGIPLILKLRDLKLSQAASGKRAIWTGLGLGLIPFSAGTIFVLYELFKRLRTGIVGGDDLFFAAFYTLVFTLFVILIGWIIGKIKFKSQ